MRETYGFVRYQPKNIAHTKVFYLLSVKQLEGCRSDCQSLGSCQVSGVSEISGTSFTDRGRSGDFFGTLEA